MPQSSKTPIATTWASRPRRLCHPTEQQRTGNPDAAQPRRRPPRADQALAEEGRRPARCEVAALLRTQQQSASGVNVIFYDGDPQHGGTAFDVERLAHIRAHDTAEARVQFRSNVCGEHRIYVTVGQGKPYEVTDTSHPFKVQCAQPKRMSGKGK